MPRFQTILHPTDFSQSSCPARELARALARELGARLILLYVAPLEFVPYGAYALPVDLEPFRAELERQKAQMQGSDLKHPVESRFSEGSIPEEILRVAEEEACDLIVMGSHGRTGLGRVLLGSVAEAVLRKAHYPVLIVKTPVPQAATVRETVGTTTRGAVPGAVA